MKHAYLIIAHNEFEVLQCLINSLDDERNDIYLHIDKKVKMIPLLLAKKSNLFVLGPEDRIDVRWGHSSQVDVEMKLFSTALSRGDYAFFHLLSGVHLPLYNQDYLYSFFAKHSMSNFFMFMPTSEGEINMKMRYRHFLVRNFMHHNRFMKKIDQFCWHVLLKIQQLAKWQRYKDQTFFKASQWVSLNTDAVQFLIKNKISIQKKYKFTFCADEFFVLSEIMNSNLRDSIINYSDLLTCDFVGTSPRTYTMADYGTLNNSSGLFARKFSQQHLDVVERIVTNLKSIS